jgi:hypothetical protein
LRHHANDLTLAWAEAHRVIMRFREPDQEISGTVDFGVRNNLLVSAAVKIILSRMLG